MDWEICFANLLTFGVECKDIGVFLLHRCVALPSDDQNVIGAVVFHQHALESVPIDLQVQSLRNSSLRTIDLYEVIFASDVIDFFVKVEESELRVWVFDAELEIWEFTLILARTAHSTRFHEAVDWGNRSETVARV